jgi:hypothetical protein
MREKLISGYATYTSAAEFGGSSAGDAPASSPVVTTISLVSVTISFLC